MCIRDRNGGVPESRLPFYIVGCILCVGLILLTTYFQYNATYFATYTESGVRRITSVSYTHLDVYKRQFQVCRR